MIELTFLYGLATIFLFGIADALASIPAKRMSPVAVTLVIDSFIFVVFGAVSIFLWDTYVWNEYTLIAMLSSVAGYLGFLLYVYALKFGKVGVSAAIANAYPTLAALFGFFVLQEFLNIYASIAILLTILGVVGLSTKFSFSRVERTSFVDKSVLFAFGAMVLWSVQVIIADRMVEHMTPFQVTHLGTIMTLVLGLTLFTLSKETFGSLLQQRKNDLFIAAFLGVLYFMGMLTLYIALKDGKLSIFAAMAGAAPLVSALFAYFFFKEKLSRREWGAIFLVIAGLGLLGVFG